MHHAQAALGAAHQLVELLLHQDVIHALVTDHQHHLVRVRGRLRARARARGRARVRVRARVIRLHQHHLGRVVRVTNQLAERL